MTDEQRKAADEFRVIRKGADVSGPFFPLLRSPELMVRTSALGDLLALPEQAATAAQRVRDPADRSRVDAADANGDTHYAIALKAGGKCRHRQRHCRRAAASRHGRRSRGALRLLPGTVADQRGQRRRLSAPSVSMFGEQGVVDTVGIVGYYSMLGMVLNTARTPGGESTAPQTTVARSVARTRAEPEIGHDP